MSKNSQIENINTLSSKGIIFAWFLGLAIFSWFNSDVNLSLITNLILAIGGMFGSSILIGIPCSMIASAWNKYKTGKVINNGNKSRYNDFINKFFLKNIKINHS